ncbi:PQQ-dependent sugar dehydrogenase [Spirosoma aureum]|uniref:PQQ-dependent sugar dehydrogenase n=1 Tax=Spirosoma aureum TaxID=2692134 RepID=A0A6G9AGE7_9BACT|nr:PQQ-dependent sugar dehydrogenase [Spirosoma aureum]QIP11530.1 PQQ-dependent sugar dehydrogenase [Spirosoma aureum]
MKIIYNWIDHRVNRSKLHATYSKSAGLLAVFLVLFFVERLQAQTFPTGFSQVQVVNGIRNPTAMVFAPDGRVFVTQQGGALRVIKNGSLLTAPLVKLTVDSTGERGLIGVVLDPAFSTNQYIYLYYTVPGTPAHNRISRFTATGDVVVSGSETVILDIDPLSGATNHNGGAMGFGKDGKLYVGIGENAFRDNAQNLDTHLGKILRINPDGSPPADNPFPTGTNQRKLVWAYGLRNPYTIAIQPGTGRVFVNDVGEGSWEEINEATAGGLNFGWPDAEGTSTNSAFTNPVYAYPHGTGDGKGCAITGGTFFSPVSTNYPSNLIGRYFYQDLCNNWINNIDLSVTPAGRSAFATSLPGNSLSMLTGPDGNLYYLSRNTGALNKIIYTPSTPDLTPNLLLPQANFPAGSSVANFVVGIYEGNGFPTSSGNVVITLTAPIGYSLAFNPSITSITISGGTGSPTTVTNTSWTVTSSQNNQISLVMKSGQFIGAGGNVNIGFSLTRTSANSNSAANLTVSVADDATNAYDSNITNNIYARIITAL